LDLNLGHFYDDGDVILNLSLPGHYYGSICACDSDLVTPLVFTIGVLVKFPRKTDVSGL